jgi:hypothetical protein
MLPDLHDASPYSHSTGSRANPLVNETPRQHVDDLPASAASTSPPVLFVSPWELDLRNRPAALTSNQSTFNDTADPNTLASILGYPSSLESSPLFRPVDQPFASRPSKTPPTSTSPHCPRSPFPSLPTDSQLPDTESRHLSSRTVSIDATSTSYLELGARLSILSELPFPEAILEDLEFAPELVKTVPYTVNSNCTNPSPPSQLGFQVNYSFRPIVLHGH